MDATSNPPRALLRRYRAALALIALVVLANQLVVQPTTLRLMTDAPVINTAGRQRMLSQEVAKAALALASSTDETQSRRARDELERALRAWTRSHEALQARGGNSAEVRRAFADLEPAFARAVGAARRVLGGDRGALADLLGGAAQFLPRMERVVALYEREARARVDRLLWTGWALAALEVAALAAVGRFVLGPASRLIARQFDELASARDALERRVAERTGELERANQRHRELVEQFGRVSRATTLGAMATGLAHELNQPLGAVANYAEGCLVALGAPAPDLGQVRGALEKLLAATLRAGAIVQRTRRFVTRGVPAVEPFDPNAIAAEVAAFFDDEARRRGATLRLDLAPQLPNLWGDAVQVQQVLANLVRNALEALAAAQAVEPLIVIATRPAGGGAAEFAVTDNGEGIPPDRIGQVFDAYFSTRDQGMGMGLAISRALVEAHEGNLTVESAPGVRTTFRFTLPARPRPRPAGAEADDPTAHDRADRLHRGG